MIVKERINHMLWSWCTVGVIYGATRFIPGKQWIIPETWLDALIPFSPAGIWLYLAFFLYVPWAFLTARADRVLTLRYAMQLSALISGLIFIIFPTSLIYPIISDESIHAHLLNLLTLIDTQQNCLPSLHAALTLLCLMSLWDWQQKLQTLFYLTVAILIGFSIIQLRRHLSIDVAAGLLLGCVSQLFVLFLQRRILRNGARIHE